MGFLNALKGAKMNLEKVESPYFPACYITLKGKDTSVFMITGAQNGDYEFTKKMLRNLDAYILALLGQNSKSYLMMASQELLLPMLTILPHNKVALRWLQSKDSLAICFN